MTAVPDLWFTSYMAEAQFKFETRAVAAHVAEALGTGSPVGRFLRLTGDAADITEVVEAAPTWVTDIMRDFTCDKEVDEALFD